MADLRRILLVTAVLITTACGKPTTRNRLKSCAVGSVQFPFQDDSRGTAANGSAPALPYRNLPTYVWYPAKADPSVAETPGAPLDPRGAPYPLVIFVHGSSGFSQQSTFFTQGLAAQGYVVAAADFPLTALTTPGGPSDFHSNEQVEDAAFLATQLFTQSAGKASVLHGALDPSAGYALSGHSTGGAVALDAAYSPEWHDSRLQAIVALAPDACFFAASMFTSRRVPMMVVAGTDDHFNPPFVNGERAFSLATTSPRWLAMLKGGTHLYFTDFDLPDGTPTPDMPGDPIVQAFSQDGGGGACTVGPVTSDPYPVIDFDLQHTLTVQLAGAFLDRWMYGDRSTLDALAASHDLHIILQAPGP